MPVIYIRFAPLGGLGVLAAILFGVSHQGSKYTKKIEDLG